LVLGDWYFRFTSSRLVLCASLLKSLAPIFQVTNY
jgi:hypothetical protein